MWNADSNQIRVGLAARTVPLAGRGHAGGGDVMTSSARHRMRTGRFSRGCRMNQIGVRIFRVAQIAAADAAVALAAIQRTARLTDASAPDTERIGLHALVIQRPGRCCNWCHSSGIFLFVCLLNKIKKLNPNRKFFKSAMKTRPSTWVVGLVTKQRLLSRFPFHLVGGCGGGEDGGRKGGLCGEGEEEEEGRGGERRRGFLLFSTSDTLLLLPRPESEREREGNFKCCTFRAVPFVCGGWGFASAIAGQSLKTIRQRATGNLKVIQVRVSVCLSVCMYVFSGGEPVNRWTCVWTRDLSHALHINGVEPR